MRPTTRPVMSASVTSVTPVSSVTSFTTLRTLLPFVRFTRRYPDSMDAFPAVCYDPNAPGEGGFDGLCSGWCAA